MNKSTSKGLSCMVAALQCEENFAKLGPRLAIIEPGYWQGLISWGNEHGYQFTLEELKDFFENQPHILKKIPCDSSISDWNFASLEKAMTS